MNNLNNKIVLTIISEPNVLYKIGKICAKGNTKNDLGILCLKDFILLIKFKNNYYLCDTLQKEKKKAYFWLFILYTQIKDYK